MLIQAKETPNRSTPFPHSPSAHPRLRECHQEQMGDEMRKVLMEGRRPDSGPISATKDGCDRGQDTYSPLSVKLELD